MLSNEFVVARDFVLEKDFVLAKEAFSFVPEVRVPASEGGVEHGTWQSNKKPWRTKPGRTWILNTYLRRLFTSMERMFLISRPQ